MRLIEWLLSLAPPPPAAPPPPPTTPTPAGPQEEAVIPWVNRYRATLNLPPLAGSPVLAQIARGRAARMAALSDPWHQPFDGAMAAAGLARDAYGECVAFGDPDARTTVADWADDAKHRPILLGPFDRAGCGLARDRQGRPYWSLVVASGRD